MDSSYGHNQPRPRITAELVRIETKKIDIKLMIDGEMHLLAWRRHAFRDEVLVNGRCQQESRGVNRETLYGLVFGRKPEVEGPDSGGVRVLFTVDPKEDWSRMDWNGVTRLRGVRLESGDGVLLSYGNLDPRTFEAPKPLSAWVEEAIGLFRTRR